MKITTLIASAAIATGAVLVYQQVKARVNTQDNSTDPGNGTDAYSVNIEKKVITDKKHVI